MHLKDPCELLQVEVLDRPEIVLHQVLLSLFLLVALEPHVEILVVELPYGLFLFLQCTSILISTHSLLRGLNAFDPYHLQFN
jgi:hypothetical protein